MELACSAFKPPFLWGLVAQRLGPLWGGGTVAGGGLNQSRGEGPSSLSPCVQGVFLPTGQSSGSSAACAVSAALARCSRPCYGSRGQGGQNWAVGGTVRVEISACADSPHCGWGWPPRQERSCQQTAGTPHLYPAHSSCAPSTRLGCQALPFCPPIRCPHGLSNQDTEEETEAQRGGTT